MWFHSSCLLTTKPHVRHGNRALTRNHSFLLFFVFCFLFLVHPDSVCLANSPYIYKVYEYCPAPGQFVNELPKYENGDDANMMRLKAEEAIADNNQGMITLGGWGGYVVFGFDHMIENNPESKDFVVLGNAFYSNSNTSQNSRNGGSCEPGIICVSYDENGNGKPDDSWYEIAGSEYNNSIHDYQLTYYSPNPNHIATPDLNNKAIIDTTYIAWQDNKNQKGYMNQIAYHTQPYFPQWIADNSLTFNGTKLNDNFIDESGNGSYYVLYAYDYGYADNHPNNSEEAQIDIDWAVDETGNPANLPGIHFVKVYTGVHQQCGWIGETSTEVTGAIDLHLITDLQSAKTPMKTPEKSFKNGHVYIMHNNHIYTIYGTQIQ